MTLKALAILFLLPISVTAQTANPPDLSSCEALFAAQPETEEPAKCFFDTTSRDPAKREKAAARLRSLQSIHPGNPWLALYAGHVDSNRSEELYRKAVEGFARRREARGEVLAHSNLQRVLFGQGRLDEAEKEAELATKVAEASGEKDLIARGRIVLARHLLLVGRDLERAYLLLRQAEPALFPDGSYSLQRDCLLGLGNVSLELGRFQEGQNAYRRLAELATANGDFFAEANAKYGIASAILDGAAELPREADRREAARWAREALDAAITVGHRGVEAKSQYLLGTLSSGEEARRHFMACLVAADAVRDRTFCLNGLARHLSAEAPRKAEETINQSLELARQAEDYWAMALAWRERMRVSWVSGPRDRAIRDSESALDAIEALRDLQTSSSSQAGMFSTWLEDYYWFHGRLLNGREKDEPGDLERAFLVAERMRARTLIDALQAARAVPASEVPLRQRRAAVLERISGIQRRLLDPDLPAEARVSASQELDRLEIEQADLLNQLNRAVPALANLSRPDFATLKMVKQALSPREALLSFQIAPWEDMQKDFAGGSWVLVTTREGTRVHRLPGRGEIRPAVRLFNGTFDGRDGSEIGPSVALYRQLLEAALKDLPAGIERLIIVPDDALNQLPFGALRSSQDAPPLASRYELTLVPSATLWLSWKGQKVEPALKPALAFADPPAPGVEDRQVRPAATERSAVFAAAFRLGALPYARKESESVVRYLRGGSARRIGDKATEAFLKHAPLHEYSMLHFATHAVTDEVNPERSGVLLAPGDAAEDGLLQIREIVDLYLNGRVVVLSACSTNTGTLLRGEGVMSLARAFFQAGAHTVVASLWPLRDDEAALFFDRFYAHLGEGLSVAAALHAAQTDRIEAGAPAAAWAGIVVLGNGDVVPLPGGRKSPALLPWIAGGAALLLLGGGIFLRRSRVSNPDR
jgi:CHAT domain-containing protein/tetratricopeptide (TPR) repeat protein